MKNASASLRTNTLTIRMVSHLDSFLTSLSPLLSYISHSVTARPYHPLKVWSLYIHYQPIHAVRHLPSPHLTYPRFRPVEYVRSSLPSLVLSHCCVFIAISRPTT
jgi:hypothetical protein